MTTSIDDVLKELRDLRQSVLGGFRQVEAIVNLYGILPVKYAMPRPTWWTACPDFLLFLVTQIQDRRPRSILDIGSGATTVWMANALRHFAVDGHIVAIDHQKEFAEETATTLQRQGLSSFADVRVAPLVDIGWTGGPWHWYDPMQLEDVENCDMVVIDGPPGNLNPLSRYPALPILSSKLSHDVRIFMDDADRPDEQAIVERWCREYPDWSTTHIDHERGTAAIMRSSWVQESPVRRTG